MLSQEVGRRAHILPTQVLRGLNKETKTWHCWEAKMHPISGTGDGAANFIS